VTVAFLILSDVHANTEALHAVLDDARGRYDRIVCLGDLAGYGAEPNEVITWARANVAAVIRGNHDKISVSDEPLDTYHPSARASTDWTRRALSPENRTFLENLPRGPLRFEDFDLVHGSPADEDEYLIGLSDATLAREFIATPLTFFGHTHVQGGFLVTRGGSKRIVPPGTLELEPDHYYLINPGAVGQPRDGDPRAAYALYSPERRTIEYRRAEYDIASAAAKIRAAGLPEHLAARLFEGA
jgi:diadenosine tetraphosphatase ApaH/serine/threonine PP2A family protein phosphatase